MELCLNNKFQLTNHIKIIEQHLVINKNLQERHQDS
jgi:hypothetical protein